VSGGVVVAVVVVAGIVVVAVVGRTNVAVCLAGWRHPPRRAAHKLAAQIT
jgi:hypothetical protein